MDHSLKIWKLDSECIKTVIEESYKHKKNASGKFVLFELKSFWFLLYLLYLLLFFVFIHWVLRFSSKAVQNLRSAFCRFFHTRHPQQLRRLREVVRKTSAFESECCKRSFEKKKIISTVIKIILSVHYLFVESQIKSLKSLHDLRNIFLFNSPVLRQQDRMLEAW